MGLSSLSLPDTLADLYRLVPKQQYLFSLKWFVLRNGKRTRRRTTVQMDDIDHLDSVVDGEHFMRAIIQHLEGQRRRGRHGDLFINDKALHWYVKWDWVRHGSEVELKINNTDMVRAGRLKTTKVTIDVALALKMGWLIQKENQDYTLGSNLHWDYIERELSKPWLRDIEKGIPNLREVQYKQQGRGTVYFEPLHVQYLPLRNTFVDQIERQIAETNGQLVRFAGPTPTILTLHFKRDL